jgi:hypothetical protein
MTGKQCFDWQTSGGTDDVMRLVDCLERADVPWCCIGGVTVNHWAEPTRRQSKQAKVFTGIARLVEGHPRLWSSLTPELRQLVKQPSA